MLNKNASLFKDYLDTIAEYIIIKEIHLKKLLVICISILVLNGCSVESITSKPPIFSGHSNQTPAKVVRCLAPKMSDLNPSTKTIETENGYRIVVSDSDFGAMTVATVDSVSAGADVKMYSFITPFGNPWGKAAQACL